tara:strand:+ start:527 stop:829 length:303 start_codon:yes stop_codon:yes gene_type:complete
MAEVKENVETPETTTEMSPEQMKKKRAEITKFYKESIKNLEVQLEYEKLLTDIEKQRAERVQAQMFLAQAYGAGEKAQSEAGQEWEEEFEGAPKRTLKRD